MGRVRAAVDKHGDGPRTKWKFLGRDVCVSAWKKLHGLGCLTNNIAKKMVEVGVKNSVIFIFLLYIRFNSVASRLRLPARSAQYIIEPSAIPFQVLDESSELIS